MGRRMTGVITNLEQRFLPPIARPFVLLSPQSPARPQRTRDKRQPLTPPSSPTPLLPTSAPTMPPFPANSDDPIVLDDSIDMDLEPVPPAAVDSSSTQPWVEKYRPKSVTSVKHQNATSTSLQSAIQTNQLPHLLFYGPPGTGKTSMALALTHQLYPSSLYKGRVLEMNASDERGLSTVRNKIKVSGCGREGIFSCSMMIYLNAR